MTQQEFTEQLAQNKARAEEISSALGSAPDDQLEGLIWEFIGCKFFLTAGEMNTDNLLRLGDQSTEKLANLKKGGLTYADKSAGCTTAGSSTIKKVLLAMALGKAVGAKLNADAVAYAETVSDLTNLILQARKGA